MHVILASLGTDGDVFPFIGLGIALRARGHRVTLASNEHYESYAAHHGFAFRALVSDQETADLLANPDVWHPIKSAIVGARWGRRALDRQYALLSELAGGDDTVLVAYPPVFAARLVHEKLARPLASLVGMPWMILSASAPPAVSAFNLPRGTPRPVANLYWRTMEAAADFLIGRHVDRLGQSLGLKPIRRIYRWCLSPQLFIGMFPEWYAPPQSDWPPQVRLAGFPLFDGGRDDGLPDDVREFCRAGHPPIAFTFGSGMMHGERQFTASVEACKILGARGILLTKHAGQLPAPWPPSVRHCSYASFRRLFPLCAAAVHHGGVGTTAQALAAAIPQLILPMAWDQPDNAARVKRLGAGAWLNPHSSGAEIAGALKKLMTTQSQARCRSVADRFGSNTAFEQAAEWVEELAARNADDRRMGAARS